MREGRGGNGTVLHLMIMVSSISSTPECNLFVKTGGTARTIDALTERNSSFAFSLRALFGEISSSMGTGELLRFIFRWWHSSVYEPFAPDRAGRDVPVLAAQAQAAGLPSQVPCFQPRHQSSASLTWYLSHLIFSGAYMTLFPPVGPKNYHPNPDHGDPNFREGAAGGRTTGCEKCVLI